MSGNPKSLNSAQRALYVVQMCEDKAVSKTGELVARNSPEAQIPYNEYWGLIKIKE